MATNIQQSELVADILLKAVTSLEQVGVSQARIDAELLLGYCLNKSRTALYLASADRIDEQSLECFSKLLQRRILREPVAYITGEQEFWSHSFKVSPDVLIPRPETEFLIETALSRRNQKLPFGKCLDLCCGSGIIAIILALELNREVVAVDISAGALEIARENGFRHGVLDSLSFIESDLASELSVDSLFGLIVSNPPYVCSQDIDNELEPEVALFEPRIALDGGRTGFDLIIRILKALPSLLCPGGDFFMEIGSQQAADVLDLFHSHKKSLLYDSVVILEDYSGRDRVVHMRREGR